MSRRYDDDTDPKLAVAAGLGVFAAIWFLPKLLIVWPFKLLRWIFWEWATLFGAQRPRKVVDVMPNYNRTDYLRDGGTEEEYAEEMDYLGYELDPKTNRWVLYEDRVPD